MNEINDNGPMPMEWFVRYQNDKKREDIYREETMEDYIATREKQKKNVKVSKSKATKRRIPRRLFAAGLVVGVAIGSNGVMLCKGQKIIANTIYPQIENTFYVTPTSGAITDSYTREYVSVDFFAEKVESLGYTPDQAAIVGEYSYGIDPTCVQGSSMLGRVKAKYDAFLNLKVEKNEEERGAMKL